MGSVGLLYVGAILFINGLMLMGLISGKGTAPLNFFVGGVQVFTPTYLIVTAGGDMSIIYSAAGLYLFGFTYLWVGLNSVFGWDGRGLGWFSLFVAVAAVGFACYDALAAANYPSAVMWIMWGILWFMFFLLLGLNKDIGAMTGWVAAVEGIVTGFIPAMLMLMDFWQANLTFALILAGIAVVMLIVMAPVSKAIFAAALRTQPEETTPDA